MAQEGNNSSGMAMTKTSSEQDSIELVVRYERVNTFFADYAKNISRGGTFVVTTEPLPKNTEFVFALAVPQMSEPLQLRAKVIWRTAAEEATAAKPAGMGIQFEYKDEAERRGLEGKIEQLMVEQLGERHVAELLSRAPLVEP